MSVIALRIVIGMDIYSILLSFILLYGLAVQPRQRTTPLFIFVLLLTILGLVSDIAYVAFDGIAGDGVKQVLRVFDFLNHALAMVIMVSLLEFFWLYLQDKGIQRESDRRYIRIVRVVCLFSVVFVGVAQSQNMFSYFDEVNSFQATDLFWVSMILPALALAVLVWFTLRYLRLLNRPERISFFICYIVLPFVSLVQQLINEHITVAYILVDVMLLILFATIYNEQAKALRDKEMRISQNRVATMLSQIKPAFLYDSLAVLQDMCLTDPTHARESVLDFTRHLRARLDAVALREMIPFEEELTHLKNYLAIEQKRLRDEIDVAYDIGTTDFSLPALSVQSIVEDMLDAGADRQRISIATYETDSDYRVEVTAGSAAGPMDALRFASVQSGLESLCGGTATLRQSAADGRCIVIRIPQGDMPGGAKELAGC